MKRKINIAIVVITITISALFAFFFGNNKPTFYSDSFGYYLYLPSTFIYHNLKMPAEDPYSADTAGQKKHIRWYLNHNIKTEKGLLLNQYTYGVALMESPFFFMAHAYEKLSGNPADGFSESYQNAIKCAAAFYAVLGLYILFLCLRRFFDTTYSLLGLSILVLGTNLLWFTIMQPGMAHVLIFFLLSSLLYLTILIDEIPRTGYFLLIGLILGIILLIRPTDILFISIPLLYKVTDIDALKDKGNFFLRYKWQIIMAMLLFCLPLIPQIIYWRAVTGHYIFYSYGNQGFDWMSPHIYKGLFSFRNGWLIYSPVMIFSIAGLFCYKAIRPFFCLLIITLPLYIYVIYSWYCFDYINGFGSRPMVNIYPLLAFPLVALITFFAKQKIVVKYLFSGAVLFLTALSFSYTIQQAKGNMITESTNKVFNLNTLFRYRLDYNDLVCFDTEIIQPAATDLKFISTLDSEDFEQFSSGNIVFDTLRNSQVYFLHNGQEYPERVLKSKFDPVRFKGAKWVRCSGLFYAPYRCETFDNHFIVLQIKSDTGNILWKSCVINNKIGFANMPAPPQGFSLTDIRKKIWGEVYFYVPLPEMLKEGDDIDMIIWGIGKQDLKMDDLKLQLYQ